MERKMLLIVVGYVGATRIVLNLKLRVRVVLTGTAGVGHRGYN